MKLDIGTEYISYCQKSIKKYLELILDQYFDEDIYNDLINAYINTRYYNLYPKVSDNFLENIVHYLKVSLQKIKDDPKLKDKARYMFKMFKYILSFDVAIETTSVRVLLSEINDFRVNILNLNDEDFEAKLYDMIEKDLEAKKSYLDSFSDKNFNIKYIKIKEEMFMCELEHKIKFSKFYSEYALNKVFNSKSINEQKLFVTYPMVATKAIGDVIKGDFSRMYIVDYIFSITEKPKKNEKLLEYIKNDIIKEKIILKLPFAEFKLDKEKVFDLTKNGYKVAAYLDETFEGNEEDLKLIKLFSICLTANKVLFDKYENSFDIIYIPEN